MSISKAKVYQKVTRRVENEAVPEVLVQEQPDNSITIYFCNTKISQKREMIELSIDLQKMNRHHYQ